MRKLLLVSGSLAGTILVGCTAILGSFDVASDQPVDGGPTTGEGGATDGAVAEGGGGEAGADGGPTVTGAEFACTAGMPRTVDTIQEQVDASFDRFLEVSRVGGVIRIYTTRRLAGAVSAQGGLVVYQFTPGSTGAISATVVNVTGEVLDLRRQGAQSETTAFAFERPTPVSSLGVPVAYHMPDSDPSTPTRVPLSTSYSGAVENKAILTGALGTYATDDTYYYALSIAHPGGLTDILFGKRTPTVPVGPPLAVGSVPTGTTGRYTIRDLVHVGANAYVFNAQIPTTGLPGNGTEYFAVPDPPATLPGSPALVDITPAGHTGYFTLDTVPTTSGLRMAAATIRADTQIEVGLGDLPTAQLGTIDASKLPVVLTLPGTSDAPLTTPYARITADDFLWIGGPADSTKGKGLNFVWYNVLTKGLRARQTGASRLLADRNGVTRSAIATSTIPTTTSAELDLVWIEDNGTVASLFWTQVHCSN